jgi:choline dehydrogenase-like flavoprotein
MANDFDVIIVGSGFGASVIASELAKRAPVPKMLMLERGVWWFTPERQMNDKFAPNFDQAYPPGDRAQEPYTKHPVQYWPRPDHRQGVTELIRAAWANIPFGDRRKTGDEPQPLYRYNIFDELDVVTASGVGGGSLIYSNVSIRPLEEAGAYPVMSGWSQPLTPLDYVDAEQWMLDYRGQPNAVVTKFPLDSVTKLPTHAARKAALQNLSTDDEKFAYLGKVRYLKEAAGKLATDPAFAAAGFTTAKSWEPLDLAVIEYPDPEAHSLDKKAYCERQGRCLIGCLPGARHTLNKSMILKLLYAGALPLLELRSLSEVTRFEKIVGGWRVHYEDLRFGDHPVAKRKRTVTTTNLVLSAGCLPTNQLMLTAKNNGLAVSDMVGRGFSTNGDFAGFIDYERNTADETKFNPRPWGIFSTRGPINASHVLFKNGAVQVNFEDATIPPMLAPFVRRAIDVAQRAASDQQAFFQTVSAMWKLQFEGFDFGAADVRVAANFQTEAELLQHTFFFNLMGTDDSRGQFSLDGHNKLQLDYPGRPLASDAVYSKMEEIVAAMVNAMNDAGKFNGKYIRFPLWGRGKILANRPDPTRKFVTVHPLGGCRMAATSTGGVVNHRGQVFDTTAGGTSVHPGLFVADASVVPGALAVNPTLTIVALAKKIAPHI